jgi:CubicO group peptidase (beta-lactamase class C family)
MMWSDAGIVSTVGDLNTFVRALAGGKLFKDEATLQTMTRLPDEGEMGYGCGVGVSRKGGHTVLFHTGGAASWWTYDLDTDTTFIGTMNDATATGRPRLGQVHAGVGAALAAQGIELVSPF